MSDTYDNRGRVYNLLPVNTFWTPNGEEPWGWRKGCIESLAQGVPLGGLAAVGLARSTGEFLRPEPR